jgi:hypothetical protein
MTYLPISLAEAKTFTGVAVNTSFYSQPMGGGTWATYSALAPLTVVDTKKAEPVEGRSTLNTAESSLHLHGVLL